MSYDTVYILQCYTMSPFQVQDLVQPQWLIFLLNLDNLAVRYEISYTAPIDGVEEACIRCVGAVVHLSSHWSVTPMTAPCYKRGMEGGGNVQRVFFICRSNHASQQIIGNSLILASQYPLTQTALFALVWDGSRYYHSPPSGSTNPNESGNPLLRVPM